MILKKIQGNKFIISIYYLTKFYIWYSENTAVPSLRMDLEVHVAGCML
jgi:hypothetical protein